MNTEKIYKTMNSYLDAHCAGFLGRPCPTYENQVDQQAADRGYWDGLKARERAAEAA